MLKRPLSNNIPRQQLPATTLEALQQKAEFKSIEFQLRSKFKLIGSVASLFRMELDQLVELEFRLKHVATPKATLPASLQGMLKTVNANKYIPLEDLEARRAYIEKLETELNKFNRIYDTPEEKAEGVEEYNKLDILIEYNLYILEHLEANYKPESDARRQKTLEETTHALSELQKSLNSKLVDYHKKNGALKKEPVTSSVVEPALASNQL